jgi:hypothetical protein
LICDVVRGLESNYHVEWKLHSKYRQRLGGWALLLTGQGTYDRRARDRKKKGAKIRNKRKRDVQV